MKKCMLFGMTLLLLSLTGCGQSGKLYLPDRQQEQTT